MPPTTIVQKQLAGIALLMEPMPRYHTASVLVRVPGGVASEPEDKLGLGCVIEQAINKGTFSYDGRQLADKLDAIGASFSVATGRETWIFSSSCLPEHLPRTLELLGEIICRPTFPGEAVETAASLAQQQLVALEDMPAGLLRRQMARQVYGAVLGRYALGTAETLRTVTASDARAHWSRCLGAATIEVAAAGALDPEAVEEAVGRAFADLPADRPPLLRHQPEFTAVRSHIAKETDQTHIGIAFPGVVYGDPEQAVEKVLLAVLSGGTSARLFTEVRQRLGLVYGASAWNEQTSSSGVIHIKAATTAERCQQTYEVLLREVARLEQDLVEEELERAKTGIISAHVTTGASVSGRAGELSIDQFYLGHAVEPEERVAAIRRVTRQEIAEYLRRHPREQLSIVTVGSAELEGDAQPAGEEA